MSDHDSIKALLEKPSEQWALEELKAGFIAALYKLNQANDLIVEQEKLCDTLRELVEQHKTNNSALLVALSTIPTALAQQPFAPKRKRGRPSKHQDLSPLYNWWLDARAKYGELTDRPLIRMAFVDMYKSHGMRESRVDSARTKGQMESLRKLLIDARQQAKRLSV